MTDTDMITWFADDGLGTTKDYWSTSNSAPKLDEKQNVEDEVPPKWNADKSKMVFVTRRKLDTEDAEDFLFKLDEDNVMSFAFNPDSADFVFHGSRNYGIWSLKISSEGEVGQAPINLT